MPATDWKALRKDIIQQLDKPGYDDGSLGKDYLIVLTLMSINY